MKKNFFNNITTIEELKKEYRKLIKLYHPDNGGDTAIMAAINNEYDLLFNKLKNIHNQKANEDTTGNTKTVNETPEQFRHIIESLLNLDGVEIEICGCWLWISGNTYTHKDILKNLGCKWAAKKKMWYWHSPEDAPTHTKKSKSMNEIRIKYGSEKIKSTGEHFISTNK